jgi:hypothetical protein
MRRAGCCGSHMMPGDAVHMNACECRSLGAGMHGALGADPPQKNWKKEISTEGDSSLPPPPKSTGLGPARRQRRTRPGSRAQHH